MLEITMCYETLEEGVRVHQNKHKRTNDSKTLLGILTIIV